MGVYNPLAEMPKSCAVCESRDSCPISNYIDGTYRPFRHPNCPLVEVKAPHGDLIDRDALLFDNSAAFHDIGGYTNAAWEAVDNAPTIIEAEGKDNG